jgi:tetratricopeptide (TPR) repeat protein
VTSSLLSNPRQSRGALVALAFGAAAALAGCGGASGKATEPEAPPAPTTEDQSFQAEKATVLEGTQWSPDALTRPSLLFSENKKKITLDKQRAVFKKAKPAQKEAEAQLLATLLFQAIKGEKEQARIAALVEEARVAFREARGAAGDQVQLPTLRNLAALELGAGDVAAAGQIFAEALAKFPTSEHAPTLKTWLALTQLRQNQNAEALATLQGLAPAPATPELSYVIAWAKWRTGDNAGAVEAISAASRGWKSSSRLVIDRDSWIFLARGGAPAETAVTVVAESNGNNRDATYVSLFKLHSAFVAAGRFADAVIVLERAAARVGEKIPVQDLAKFYIQQADYTLRAGIAPDQVVAFQEKALATYATCADKCTKEEHEEGAVTTRNLATFFDTIYRTARDDRFYEPAAKLYAAYAAIPGRADVAEVKRFADEMKSAKMAPEQPPGKHDPGFMLTLVDLHSLEVLACYEQVLVTEPTVAGELAMTVEIAETGVVKGVAVEPAAGAAGLAKVATCASEKAKAWGFPSRTKPGTTRVAVKYQLAPQAPKQP